jgi:predicted phosphodiesterase
MSMRPLVRIGAIGDIHAEDETLERVLDHLAGLRLARILAVGDIVDGPGDSARCCRLLAAAGVDVVRGNHDRWALEDQLRNLPGALAALDPEQRRFLEALPATRDYQTVAGPLLLCHGLGADDMCRLTDDDFGYALESNDPLQELLATEQYRFVVNGHTHRRMVRHFGGLAVINAGTLFRENDPCFAVIDIAAGRVEFFDVGAGVIAAATVHSLANPG